jgi:hypothetical protein
MEMPFQAAAMLETFEAFGPMARIAEASFFFSLDT